MTDKEIFNKFKEKNDWRDSDSCVELNIKQLEKIILTACKYAREDGFENGKRIANNLHKAAGGSGMDIFNQIFGGKK
jgi:hypothetical protein